MREEMIEAMSELEAREMCPWAAVVVEVDGGYMCFESTSDAETWNGQA